MNTIETTYYVIRHSDMGKYYFYDEYGYRVSNLRAAKGYSYMDAKGIHKIYKNLTNCEILKLDTTIVVSRCDENILNLECYWAD